MKISMMQVALATAVARGIAHYPYSIADSVVNMFTFAEYNMPNFESLSSLVMQSKISDYFSMNPSLSNLGVDEDYVRDNVMRYLEDADTYANEVYDHMRDDVRKKRSVSSQGSTPIVEAKYCQQYFASLFTKGGGGGSTLDLNQYKALLRSIPNGSDSIWMNEEKVMEFGFKIMDHDDNSVIDLSEWMAIASEMVPVEISIQPNGLYYGHRSYVEC